MEQENRASGEHEAIPHRPRESWDIGAISHALHQDPAVARDIAHGPGIRYALADGALSVELFPPHAERRTGIVRLTTADSLQEFYRQPKPAIRAEGLIFETREHLISLSPTGELMTYRLVPQEGTQKPPDAARIDEKDSDTPEGDRDPTDDSGASGMAFQNALPETEGQPRVTYSGRLGIAPRTKLTPNGRFVMTFPVAVPIEGQEKPEWRTTVVFDEKARKLEGVLARGMSVDVVAYEHRKLRRDQKTGRTRESVEYYATAVRPKLNKRDAGATAAEGASERQRP
jgi:hypothetical protein